MNEIKKYTEQEKIDYAYLALSNLHKLFGVQCQNCKWYEPEKEVDGYRGVCTSIEEYKHGTYWSQYCDDFEARDDDEVSRTEDND